MSNEDVAAVKTNETELLAGQPLFRTGFYFFAATAILFAIARTGAGMFDNIPLDFAIVLASAMAGSFFAASIRGGNKAGRDITRWCVALTAFNALMFLIGPLVR